MPIKKYAGLLLFILVISFPIFSYLDSSPMQAWDEARLANNAIEMNHNNNWLISMMDGKPDMWSTKPPFMIWMQVLSIRMLGTSELATRMPSAIAALFTCLLMLFFFVRKFKAPAWGVISVLMLITTQGYVKAHGIRTGDFDSLLTLFTTGYCFAYFLYLEEGKRKYIYATFILLTLAGLTKGIQAVMFIPALLIYTIYRKKIVYMLKNKDTYIGIGIFILFVVGFYLLREHYNPGYIAAVAVNEWGGRFNTVIEGHVGDGWFYYNLVTEVDLSWYVLLIPGTIAGFLHKDKRVRDLFALSVVLIITYFLFISQAQTKIEWYLVPLYPFFAIIGGFFIYTIYTLLAEFTGWKTFLTYNALPSIFVIIVFLLPYQSIVKSVNNRDFEAWMEGSRKDLKIYLKDVLEHKRSADGYQILEDDFWQDLVWYTKEYKYEGHPVPVVNLETLDPMGKLVVYKPGSKKIIEDNYNFSVIGTSGGVTFYQLNGKKKLPVSP